MFSITVNNVSTVSSLDLCNSPVCCDNEESQLSGITTSEDEESLGFVYAVN